MTSGPGTTAGIPPAGAAQPPQLPARWPPAWRSLWSLVAGRAAFVVATAALTAVGLLLAGDPDAQWWLPLIPLALLAGPVLRPFRIRRAVVRAAVAGRLRVQPAEHGGRPALLVGYRRAAALVLPGGDVRYLAGRAPRGGRVIR